MNKKRFISRQNKTAIKTIIGRNSGRSVTVFPDDIFIVSYPKSGNTWVRFLVGNLICENTKVDFENIEKKVPDIYQNVERELLRIPRPRILKSHEYFDYRYKKVIYIVRDPRDVVVSYYHYHQKVGRINENDPIEQYLFRFISGDLDQFGSWGEHVGSWLGAREVSNKFLLIRYEDLIKNTYDELVKIADFMSLSYDKTKLHKVIGNSSSTNMRKLEKEQSHLWKATVGSNKNKPFVRSAKAGNWKNELPNHLAEEIERVWEKYMNLFNYC